MPFVGHTGIGTTTGIIRDFAGSYFVSVRRAAARAGRAAGSGSAAMQTDNMAFGWPTKYVQLDPSLCASSYDWDAGVAAGSEEYLHHTHNLFCDNCHSHVAKCLNLMRYRGRDDWTMFTVVLLLAARARYVSWTALVRTWLPFCMILAVIVLLVLLT